MSLATDIGLAPVAGKSYKLYLVEHDDENRERVLEARTGPVEITVVPQYSDIHTDYSNYPVKRYRDSEDVTLTIKLVPSENGTYFTITNFAEDGEASNMEEEEEE